MTERAYTAVATQTRDPFRLAAGLGGLVFFVALVLGNSLRFNAVNFFPPVAGASHEDIAQFYAVRGALLGPALVYYAAGVPGLLLFVIGTARRIAAHPTAAVWGWAGAAALSCMPATFGAVVALEAVLANTVANGGREMTMTLWNVKEAFFFVNDVVLSIGLTALAIGSAVAGTSPRWLTSVAAAAGTISLIMVAPLAANVAGATTGWFAFVSFGAWMMFLLNTSIAHLRATTEGDVATRQTVAAAAMA
jgi:hypothetical protein